MGADVTSRRDSDFMNESAQSFVVLHELIEAGLAALDPVARDYLVGGAESEATILRNRVAIDRRAFRPRVLVDVSQASLETDLLSKRSAMPVFLAPIGALHRFHPDGCLAAAKAASQLELPMFFGSLSPRPLPEMRSATEHVAVYQLYIRDDKPRVDETVREIEAVGFDALCLTVDSAVYSRRERDKVRRIQKSWRKAFTPDALTYQASFTWKDIERLRGITTMPIILKGIAAAEDARLALEHGVDIIYVSNHGGRQLDHALGTLDALLEIQSTVAGQTTVFVDGGFMRGSDILKALALGADGVGLGRLYCLALAADGVEGVVRMLRILQDELQTALALVGADSPSRLTRQMVVDQAFPPAPPHLFSSFPLLKPADHE